MKRRLKEVIGRAVIASAEALPVSKPLLRPLGLRTSHGVFGSRTVCVQTSRKRPFRLTNIDESYLAFQLFWRGGDYYEPLTRALLESVLRPGDLFLDIGAHIGFFSLTMGVSIRQLKLIAFEPNPKNFGILKANAAANRLDNLVCEPFAISDQEGTGILYLTDSDMSASLMKDFQAEDTKQIGSTEVQTTSLDAYLRKVGIAGPMVIKIDIEGHEPAFFRGAKHTLATHKPDIILEVLYDQEPELVAYLKSLGYHFYPITDGGFLELQAPRLVKRFPFLFLNHLISVRPKAEVEQLFARANKAIRKIDLRKTSEHFPKEEWPLLWRTEPEAVKEKSSAANG